MAARRRSRFLSNIGRAAKTSATRSMRLNRAIKRHLFQRAHCVFVTALPKSGSTYLTTLLLGATGFIPYFLGDDHLNEQDLCEQKLIDAWNMNVVAHQHTRATRINLERMHAYRIRPVVLTRDIFDCATSLLDHLHRESRDNPTFSVDDGFLAMPRARQLDAIVDLALPWHVQFVAAWQRADIDRLWVTYRELVSDCEPTVVRVLDFYGLPRDGARVDQALERAQHTFTRFNVGSTRRGADEFSDEQCERVIALTRHFPDVDFSCVGLGPEQASARAART